jgi:hypothetical protein
MRKKKRAKPAWWKSSYFWITGILVLIAIYGFVTSPSAIADPSQTNSGPRSPGEIRTLAAGIALPLLYLGAAVLMGFNAVLSHRQYVAQYRAEQEEKEP